MLLEPEVHDVHRILTLDDDEIMRDLLQALLSVEGFEVALASSGLEALAQLTQALFDLVLTDLHMPGLEGAELADSLRQVMPPTSLLIGMSSVEPAPELLSRLDAFLLKPFDVQLLRHAIGTAQQKSAAKNRVYKSDSDLSDEGALINTQPLNDETFNSLASMISLAQLQELFAMALKDIGKRHDRMLEAASRDDLLAVQREAHAFKGSCGMLGAVELQQLAATIEEAPTVHTSALVAIPQACARLQRMLETKFHTA